MKKLTLFLHKWLGNHDKYWAYTEGRFPGLGKTVRSMCFRRVCTKCWYTEEINRWNLGGQSPHGEYLLRGPEWVEVTEQSRLEEIASHE